MKREGVAFPEVDIRKEWRIVLRLRETDLRCAGLEPDAILTTLSQYLALKEI